MGKRDLDIIGLVDTLKQSKQPAALCLIVRTSGSTPRKIGAKMLVFADGTIAGTIGGGELEKKVIENALSVIQHNKPQWYRHDLLHQLNMCCGGTVELYIEPLMKPLNLFIFGAGHTGSALADYAVDFGFEVFLIDDRKEYIEQCKNEKVNKMGLPFKQALSLLPFDSQTFVCIMTYEHDLDREILSFCLKKSHAYLGMIGSKRKVEVTKKMFLDAAFCSKEELEEVDMPMGFDINANGPFEIALSIMAGLLAVKNKKNKPI